MFITIYQFITILDSMFITRYVESLLRMVMMVLRLLSSSWSLLADSVSGFLRNL
jgi:hypothetical protein